MSGYVSPKKDGNTGSTLHLHHIHIERVLRVEADAPLPPMEKTYPSPQPASLVARKAHEAHVRIATKNPGHGTAPLSDRLPHGARRGTTLLWQQTVPKPVEAEARHARVQTGRRPSHNPANSSSDASLLSLT